MRSCPNRAFGVGWGARRAGRATQAVQLTAPREVRSSSPLSITLDAGKLERAGVRDRRGGRRGHPVAHRVRQPDPLAQLFAKRALGVETYETIGWTMLHQPAGASSKTGGGDDRDGDGIPDAADGALGGRSSRSSGRAVLRRGRGRRRRQADDPVQVPQYAASCG